MPSSLNKHLKLTEMGFILGGGDKKFIYINL